MIEETGALVLTLPIKTTTLDRNPAYEVQGFNIHTEDGWRQIAGAPATSMLMRTLAEAVLEWIDANRVTLQEPSEFGIRVRLIKDDGSTSYAVRTNSSPLAPWSLSDPVDGYWTLGWRSLNERFIIEVMD